MANSITDWKFCRQGGHQVPAAKMTSIVVNGFTVRLCEDCKAKKVQHRKMEPKRRIA